MRIRRTGRRVVGSIGSWQVSVAGRSYRQAKGVSVSRTGRILAGLVLVFAPVAILAAPSGAIFTTVFDGSEVNVNQFPSKDAVYLDGGPGIGAPQTAAGLDDGTYVFQVTDPSGKTLLSTDNAICRQFTVVNGIITGVVVTGCEHHTDLDVDHGATTVQLIPYNDTPNPGGVYKAWATPVEAFLAGCELLGENDGLNVVDCGGPSNGNFHGFVEADSKTDNFKVKEVPIREIDTFFLINGIRTPGYKVTWFDPLGASNNKWSYLNKFYHVNEAHVEAVEPGKHKIVLENQPGCIIGDIYQGDFEQMSNKPRKIGHGPQTVTITIQGGTKATSPFLNVTCQ